MTEQTYNEGVEMACFNYNSLLVSCWIAGRACPRRHLAALPSHARPNLFGSD